MAGEEDYVENEFLSAEDVRDLHKSSLRHFNKLYFLARFWVYFQVSEVRMPKFVILNLEPVNQFFEMFLVFFLRHMGWFAWPFDNNFQMWGPFNSLLHPFQALYFELLNIDERKVNYQIFRKNVIDQINLNLLDSIISSFIIFDGFVGLDYWGSDVPLVDDKIGRSFCVAGCVWIYCGDILMIIQIDIFYEDFSGDFAGFENEHFTLGADDLPEDHGFETQLGSYLPWFLPPL